MTAYSDISAQFGRISALSNAIGILDWDNATMMPRSEEHTSNSSHAITSRMPSSA